MSIKKVHRSRYYTWKTKRKKKENSCQRAGYHDVLNFKPCFLQSSTYHSKMLVKVSIVKGMVHSQIK